MKYIDDCLGMCTSKFTDVIDLDEHISKLPLDYIRDWLLKKYCLDNPDDVSLTNVFNFDFDPADEESVSFSVSMCYEYLIRNDRIDIIRYIISNSSKKSIELF